MSNVFPRQNGKSTLALNFTRLQQELNEANYRTYVERVKNDLLEKENQQLKELLKQWMHFYPIILYEHEDTLKTKDIVELFDKTREVLK